ncbi:hypothetical protein L486_02172 [Kwoniella mangroviensis CBS 10435]|uniref:BTB domain-containing protein n=1 Tax=Kwoniella mangroviensis CBS 10435 TaxID=1331196 RepID=A0A1B9IVF6_9TREE|nr:hypothetical protein L486_02172 [Kwoniella mangroviensis CBS 10435]
MTGSSSESISRPKPQKKSVHPFHRYGDIQLISKDGIILMADSRRLSNLSSRMRVEVSRALKKEKEVDMRRWSSQTTSLFLDVIDVSKPKEPIVDLPELFELTSIYAQYVSPVDDDFLESLAERMLDLAQTDNLQWSLLLFADEVLPEDQGVRLAKLTLLAMTKEAFLHPVLYDFDKKEFEKVIFWEAVGRLHYPWKGQLLRLTLIVPYDRTGDSNEIKVTTNWEQVANEFDPE